MEFKNVYKRSKKGGYVMKKFIISTTLLLFFSMGVYAVIFCNDTPCGYEGSCTNGTGGTSGIKSFYGNMNTLVVIGAGQFLESNSNFQGFLQKYELTELYGFDFYTLNKIITDAIIGMEQAADTYEYLVMIAEVTPYNQVFIDKLKTFDYDGFQERFNLNNQVFQKTKRFLLAGDITGAYKSILIDIRGIIESLNFIKDSIDKNVLPEVSKVWELNQKYSDTLFFGQYMAMVCHKIK
jgi:hypothetical protein